MKTPNTEVEMWDIDKIIPYPQNNKQHPPSQIDKIASSMKNFGVDVPLVVDGKGVLLKGHGRRLAALKIGLKQLPVIVRTDLTPNQIRAARIADNRVSQSDFDMDALFAEMEALNDEGFDLSATGFDPEEIAKLFGIDLDETPIGEESPKDNYSQQYGVIAMCDSEAHQEEVYNKLSEMGYNVKVVVT
jgi:ParB-like chromosome segregation protein Spo0J